ncbi:hypothetical protein [Streptomyces chrestomyceticus]|uniref:hypothetical protein n=1 Tax=Streptomyces chrestomyceticus TaxID=68185 RepID=UPI002F92B109
MRGAVQQPRHQLLITQPARSRTVQQLEETVGDAWTTPRRNRRASCWDQVAQAVTDKGTVYGDLKSLGPVIRTSETAPRWSKATPRLGSSRPEWLPR